ncbi:MAG: hypothetical protein ACLQFI_02875 [Methylocella sp.]
MLVPCDQGRAELKAHKFSPDKGKKDKDGEWWLAPPNAYPSLFLQYFGERKDHFDRDQLSHVLTSVVNKNIH